MKKRCGLILAAPFLFAFVATAMIMSLFVWLFTGKGIFEEAIDITEKFIEN